MSTCPTCHGSGQVAPGYKLTSPPIKRRPFTFLRSEPPDARTVEAVLIPLKQAVISAVIPSVICGTVATMTPAAEWWPQVALLSGVVAGGFVWLSGVNDDKKRLWWQLKRDGRSVEQPQKPLTVKAPDPVLDGPAPSVLVNDQKPGEKYPHWNSYDVPWSSYREARNVARAVLRWGQSFTRDSLKNVGVISKDDAKYKPIYQAMLKNGFLVRGNSQPTVKGRNYLEGLLAPYPPVKRGKK